MTDFRVVSSIETFWSDRSTMIQESSSIFTWKSRAQHEEKMCRPEESRHGISIRARSRNSGNSHPS